MIVQHQAHNVSGSQFSRQPARPAQSDGGRDPQDSVTLHDSDAMTPEQVRKIAIGATAVSLASFGASFATFAAIDLAMLEPTSAVARLVGLGGMMTGMVSGTIAYAMWRA